MMWSVEPITRAECEPFIIGIHYARRWPSVSKAFGLFDDGCSGLFPIRQLVGCVTYGCPPSSPLRKGVAGDEYASCVLELNRLCLLYNQRNQASFLVGRSLRLLGGDHIVISFADTEQNHLGTVYQATNWMYCGLSAKRTDWKIRGKEHLHGHTVADEFRGTPNRAAAMRRKYGDDFYLRDRPRKHRYVYFVGSKKFRKAARASLRYSVQPYPCNLLT